MDKTITLREANQTFARCVREVEGGAVYVITRNGQPVARLAPITSERVLTAEQRAAWERLQARMDQGWEINAGRLDRDSMHER